MPSFLLSTFWTSVIAATPLYHLPELATPNLGGRNSNIESYEKYFAKKAILPEYIISEYQKHIQTELNSTESCNLDLGQKINSTNEVNNISRKDFSKLLNWGYLNKNWDDLFYQLLFEQIQLNEIKLPKTKKKYSQKTLNFIEKNKTKLISYLDHKKICSHFSDFNLIRNFMKHNHLKKKDFAEIAAYLYQHEHITTEVYRTVVMAINTNLSGLNLKKFYLRVQNAQNSYTPERNALILKNSSFQESQTDQTISNYTTKFYLGNSPLKSPRTLLYQRFNDDEIKLLAQMLYKASIRLMADHAELNIIYDENNTEHFETYVLSPMEKYRMSLRMLELDVTKLSLNEHFEDIEEAYQAIVLAGIETGVITLSEVNQVLKFEDFWNPHYPEWKKWVNFTLTIGATASLALPPPWNFISASGLSLLRSGVFNKKRLKKDHDNVESLF
jgi:hypothetical protein